MAKAEPRFYEGQTVYVTDPNFGKGEPVRLTVLRVGRSLAYVNYRGRETAFGNEDGVEHRTKYTPLRFVTEAEHLAATRRASVERRLNDHGFRPVASKFPQSTEVLEAIADLLDDRAE